MPLTDEQAQQLILREVGDVDPDSGDPVASGGALDAVIGLLWVRHAPRALTSPELRDLYVRRDAHGVVIAVLAPHALDFSVDDGALSLKRNQQLVAHQKERDVLQAEIERFERRLAAGGVAVGQLTTVAPIDPPLPGAAPQTRRDRPDANSPVYDGSPYWSTRRTNDVR